MKRFYWWSPVAGVAGQCLVGGLLAAGNALWGEHADIEPVAVGPGFLFLVYGLALVPVLLYTYGYLFLLKWLPGRYRLLTASTAGLAAAGSLMAWSGLAACWWGWRQILVALGIYLVWMGAYFGPVFWAGYRYAKRAAGRDGVESLFNRL